MVRIMIVLITAIALTAAMLDRTEADDYTVGDDLGWTIPPDGADTYADWAAAHNPLVVGVDNITFEFPIGEQDVAFVTKADFDNCTITIPLWESPEPAKVTFVEAGTFYFIGTFDGHCKKGQKIALNWINSPEMAPSQSPSPSSFAAAEANSNPKRPLKRVSLTTRGAI